MMKQSLTQLTFLALVVGATGCSFAARNAEMYRNDTRALLETKNAEIKQCYDTALVNDPNVSGTVAVRFTVQEETGKIVDAAILPERTNAPDALCRCVLQAINTLTLDPPDANDGYASFLFDFTVSAPPPAPGPEGAPASDVPAPPPPPG